MMAADEQWLQFQAAQTASSTFTIALENQELPGDVTCKPDGLWFPLFF